MDEKNVVVEKAISGIQNLFIACWSRRKNFKIIRILSNTVIKSSVLLPKGGNKNVLIIS